MGGYRIILGSASPRRKEILSGMGVEFTVDTDTGFDEKYSPDMPHDEIPAIMSRGKSHGFHRDLEENEILVTSDTMVLCGEEILGKPKDREDAVRMLRLLSGRGHKVTTAVTLRDRNHETTFSDTAHVFFKQLTENEIEHYIDRYRPFDKAGAYAIQEWIGYIGITRIEGSFYTIMGFPAHRFYEELEKFMTWKE